MQETEIIAARSKRPRSTRGVDIYSLARSCGVTLKDGPLHSPASRRPGECFCKPTIRTIGREHGADHLRLVLMLLTGTKRNARHLFADVVTATSTLLVAHPDLIKSPSLVSDFDAIDFGDLRRQINLLRLPVERWKLLVSLLAIRLVKPSQPDLLDVEGFRL
ncbi:hypothetical protein C8J38_11028 [Rhizobium sp. PP-WC-2G-219]|nr:hypothetical protein C8J38_11028 [Rhizobium sp. PP-WC-2G-219]